MVKKERVIDIDALRGLALVAAAYQHVIGIYIRSVTFIRPQVNIVVILLVILAFSVIDLYVVPTVTSEQVKATPEYRCCLDHLTYGELKSFVDLINQDKSPKIITTGDSIIHGGGVRSGKETIAHYLQSDVNQTNPGYHVYNLGLKGAHPADTLLILLSLRLTEQDIVVYDLNLNLYDKTPAQFPDVSTLFHKSEYKGVDLNQFIQPESKTLERTLQNFLTKHWRLYANREFIKNILLPQKQLKLEPDITYIPWYEKDWHGAFGKYAKRGEIPITNQNSFVLLSMYVVNAVIEHNTKMLVFNIPLNYELLDLYNELDRSGYKKNKEFMKTRLEEGGAVYQDYETVVPSHYFTDTLHPTAEGNKIIAKRLAVDLLPWIRRGVSR